MPREKEDLLRENERLRATCEKAQEERLIYARLHALTGSFLVVYVVDPETDRYREFSATDDYVESFDDERWNTERRRRRRTDSVCARIRERPAVCAERRTVQAAPGRAGCDCQGVRKVLQQQPLR